MDIYALLQEMINYPSRCIIVIVFIQVFFNIAIIPMLIQDIKNKTPDSILSTISYCTSCGINLLLTLQVVCITDGVNDIVRFISIAISFGLCTAVNLWLIVASGYKERRK